MRDDEIQLREIRTEEALRAVLDLCYAVLGEAQPDFYQYDAWLERLHNGKQPLLYAEDANGVAAAVLGRAENADSLVIGFVVCREDCRRKGIAKRLMAVCETRAREMGFRYITLGSMEDAFYTACGYSVIFQVNGQNIYQKVL